MHVDEDAVPDAFLCPISQTVMLDPVIAEVRLFEMLRKFRLIYWSGRPHVRAGGHHRVASQERDEPHDT